MATSAFEDRLSSKAYKTWLKAGLCLGFLKEGLCPFIERESQTLYSNVLSKVRPSVLCGGLCGPLPQCTTCKAQNIVWNNRNRKWELNQCPVFLCHNFVTTIQQEHVSPQPRGMCWKNSNVQAWPSRPWEVAKTLMDTIEDGTKKTRPAECDCSSLLKFIEYSKVCQGKISTGDATKVRQHRNKIMHSSNMELSDADLRKFANDMITLLKSIGDYVTNIPAQTAVQHIEQARDTDIEITVGDEIRVLTETQQGIQNTVKKQFEDMRKLKNTLSDLETKTAGKTEEHGKELKELSGIAQEHRKGMEKLERETEERLGKQEHEVGRLTETMEDTEERLKKQEDWVGRLTETMEDTGERLKKQEDRMGRLTETMEDSGEDMKKTTKEMSADREKLKRELEEKLNYIKSIEGRLQKLESPKTTSERGQEMSLQQLIEKHLCFLEEELDMFYLKDRFIEAEVFSDAEITSIPASDTRRSRSHQLLLMLSKKDEDALKAFLHVLLDANEDYVIQHLLEESKKTEKRCSVQGASPKPYETCKMAEHLWEKIRRNLVQIKDEVDMADLLDYFQQENVFNTEDKAEINQALRNSPKEGKEKFYETLPCRGDRAYYVFIKALKSQGYSPIADTIETLPETLPETLVQDHGMPRRGRDEANLGSMVQAVRGDRHRKRQQKDDALAPAAPEKRPRESMHTRDTGISTRDLAQGNQRAEIQESQTTEGTSTAPVGIGTSNRQSAAIDLQGFLLDHYREKFSSIPVSPMFSKKTVQLESLFTELVVVEDIDKGLGQMPQRGQKEEREVPVSSYEDIFHKDDKRMKDIYLIAEGGAGKTVSCKQIVNTWVRTHEQQQVVGCLNHNETVMNGFKYLFFVPLREVSGKTDLIDAVCDCLTDQAPIQTMIRNVLYTSPEKVLVVLDGLDEVKVIPDRHRSHSYTILTTTRPWKFDIVQQSDHLEVDRLLKLKGLDNERIPELIDKVLENCYDDTTKVARKNIQTNIESHGLMTSARIPLVLVSLIHMCHEQKSLSPSQTRTMQDIIDCIIECNEKKIQSGDLYPAPEQVAQPLKGIKDEECSLLKYRGVIMALSKLAFYALINDNKENSLVFSKKTLRKYFSSDSDLQLCLTLGLLSKTEQLGYLKKNVEISFPHKVFQEWFAALCVVNDTEAFTKLKQYLMSTETILDMSNVFAFVCGMCGESASGLTKRVMEICTSSPDIQHFRTTAKYSSIVERLTDMYIRCATECETTGQVGTTVLYISDIWVTLRDTVNNDMYNRAVSYLIDTNASRLTAVSLCNLTYPPQSVPQVIREALCNHTFDSLQKLYVLVVDVAVVNSMLTNNPGIQVLVVWYWDQSGVGLCLPLLQQLQHLELTNIPVTRDFPQQLSALLHLGQLRSLCLGNSDIGDHYLDLSSLTHLTTLTLEYITMTSSVWQGMLQTMNTLQSLQVLELESIRQCGDTRSGTTTQMSTRFMSQLQELKCTCTWDSPQVCLPLLPGLHDASSLRSLVIEGYHVPTEQVTMIVRAIPHLYQLEKLELGYINFPDQQLSLKYNTKLQKLILTSVQLSPTSWQHLFDSLQSLQHLNYIKLLGVNISLDDVRLPEHLVITSHHNSVVGAGGIDVECKQI